MGVIETDDTEDNEDYYPTAARGCGGIDRDGGNNAPAPPALNCYRCHSVQSMLPVPNGTKEEPMPERTAR